jgi:signal peptidase I
MSVNVTCDQERRRCKVRREIWYLGLAICMLNFGLKEWVLWPCKISGESMLPNYTDGQVNYINKLAYLADIPRRGDVVGVKLPGGEVLIKRIVGLPGEQIDFVQGKVIINGEELTEPYPVRSLLWNVPSFQLGPNDYFVMGDNRRVSQLGPITRDNIIGRVVF